MRWKQCGCRRKSKTWKPLSLRNSHPSRHQRQLMPLIPALGGMQEEDCRECKTQDALYSSPLWPTEWDSLKRDRRRRRREERRWSWWFRGKSQQQQQKQNRIPGRVAQACNPRNQEAEAGGSVQVQSPLIYVESLKIKAKWPLSKIQSRKQLTFVQSNGSQPSQCCEPLIQCLTL